MFRFAIVLIFFQLGQVLGSPIVWPESEDNEDLQFPSEIETNLGHVSKDVITNCAKGKTFCEDLEYYPVNQLKQILNNTPYLNNSFFEPSRKDPNDLSNRSLYQEEHICPYTRTTIYPKVAMTEKDQWKFIFNFEKYNQGVEVEYCRTKKSSCRLMPSSPMGYVTFCKQKYLRKKLLSVSDEGDKEFEHFLLPSACVCSYKRTLIHSFSPTSFRKTR